MPARPHAQHGGGGQGTWQNGRNAPPLIIRELPPDDPCRSKNQYEAEAKALQGPSPQESCAKMREKRWVHYPEYADDNAQREDFKHAGRERRRMRRLRAENPIYLDLDKPEEAAEAADPNAPLGHRRSEPMGHLIAHGGAGGLGNPAFLSSTNRSPKWATRGAEGERISLSLELKLLADIGLVGMPRALTGRRACTEVAGYAFTTLNPIVAVVRVAEDGSFDGDVEGAVHEETRVEEAHERALLDSGALADTLTRNQRRAQDATLAESDPFAALEAFRFTVADNPGLIEHASANVGLGHVFLRSMERSHALVYVVDLSMPEPWEELRVLQDELEQYKPGMSEQARMVVANKADLLAGGADASVEEVEAARAKLKRLETFVAEEMRVPVRDADDTVVGGRSLDVVPISAKFSMNLKKVVRLMRTYVEEARERKATSS